MPGFQLLMKPCDETLCYDGSLAGFYTCVHACVYGHVLPQGIHRQDEPQQSLLPARPIATDIAAATRVREAVRRRISPRTLELCENVFLSDMTGKEKALLEFIALGFQDGGRVAGYFAHPLVNRLLKAERNLLGEAHLLTGFIRFADGGGKLHAAISPKNFVLPLLVPHFVDRYSQEVFLIFDRTHQVALLHQNGQSELMEAEEIQSMEPSQDERLYQALWKRFCQTISIKERENPRCRMSHMPKRYWQNMTEMQGLS